MDSVAHNSNLESLLSSKDRYKFVEDLEKIGPESFTKPIDAPILSDVFERCTKLTTIHLDEIEVTQELSKVLASFIKLSALKISNCKNTEELEEFPIWDIIKGYTNLTKLTLTHCPKISDQSLKILGQKAPPLNYLNLEGSKKITQKGVEVILKNCTHLQELDVTDCRNIKDLVLPIEATNLRVVILEGTPISHPLSTSFLLLGDLQRKLCMTANNLKNEEKKKRLKDGVIQLSRAIQNYPNSETMRISVALRILGDIKKMQSQFEEKNRGCDQLKEAEQALLEAKRLAPNDATTYRILGEIYRMRSVLARNLDPFEEGKLLSAAISHLEISKNLNPYDPITTLLLDDIKRLQTKNQSKKEKKENEAATQQEILPQAYLQKIENSKELDLSPFNYVVTDQTLQAIQDKAKGTLEKLNLKGCIHVNQKRVELLLQHCTNLQKLDLTACTQIVDLQLPIEARNLEELYLENTGIVKPNYASHSKLGALQRLQSDSLIGDGKTNKLNKAKGNFLKALEEDKPDPFVIARLFDVEIKISFPFENEDEILDDLEKKLKYFLININQEDYPYESFLIYRNLGDLQRLQSYLLIGDVRATKLEEAKRNLFQALKKEPKDPFILARLFDVEIKISFPFENKVDKLLEFEENLKKLLDSIDQEHYPYESFLIYYNLGDLHRLHSDILTGEEKRKMLETAEKKFKCALDLKLLDKNVEIEKINTIIYLADVERMQSYLLEKNKKKAKLKKARDRLEAIAEKGISNLFILSRLGDIQRMQTDFQNAEKNLNKALSECDNDVFSLCCLASTLKMKSEVKDVENKEELLKKAEHLYRTALTPNSKDFDVFFELGKIQASLKSFIEAEKTLSKAFEINSQDIKCLILLSSVQIELAHKIHDDYQSKRQASKGCEAFVAQLKKTRANFKIASHANGSNFQFHCKYGEVEKRIALKTLDANEKTQSLSQARYSLLQANNLSSNNFIILYHLIDVLLSQVEDLFGKRVQDLSKKEKQEKALTKGLAEQLLTNFRTLVPPQSTKLNVQLTEKNNKINPSLYS